LEDVGEELADASDPELHFECLVHGPK